MPYFGKHGAKNTFMEIPLNLVIKLGVKASPLGYCIQFCPYLVKDSQLSEYRDIGLGLGVAVVVHLAQFLPAPNDDHSEYHLSMDNFFTLSGLLRHLQKSLLLRLEPCELVGCKILISHRSTKLEKWKEGFQMSLLRHLRILLSSDVKTIKLSMFFPHTSQKMNKKRQNATAKKRRKASEYFCVMS